MEQVHKRKIQENKELGSIENKNVPKIYKSLLKSKLSPIKSPQDKGGLKGVTFNENINILTIPNRIQSSIESGEIVDYDVGKEKQELLPPMNALTDSFVLPKNAVRGPLNIKVIKKIGSGGYGEVYHVAVMEKVNPIPKHFPKNNNYALKRMIDLKRNRAYEYEQEIMYYIMKEYPRCAPHVLCYFDISIDKDGRYYLLSEMLDGDILSYFNHLLSTVNDDEKLRKKKMKLALTVAEQTLAGLKELEKIGLLHRDLKEENLLYKHQVGPTGRVRPSKLDIKLADFGLSCILDSKTLKCGNKVIGTSGYIDPKLILEVRKRDKEDVVEIEEIWDQTNDIYSLAIILYQILFDDYLEKSQIQNLKNIDEDDDFVEEYEKIYKQNKKYIEDELKTYGKKSKQAKLLQFILKNTNPFEKKQTIDQAIQIMK